MGIFCLASDRKVSIGNGIYERCGISILEEYWYGNIEPKEYDDSPSKEYKELTRLIYRNKIFLATMTDEEKDLFIWYTDLVREDQSMIKYLLFQNSFRLGVEMMPEVMGES